MEKNEFYLKSLELIEARNESRLHDSLNTPIENETETLFVWMLSQFHLRMEGTYPAAQSYQIEFKGSSWGHTPGIRYGYISRYSANYVQIQKDFIDVINNVANIFKNHKNFDVPFLNIPRRNVINDELSIVLQYTSRS